MRRPGMGLDGGGGGVNRLCASFRYSVSSRRQASGPWFSLECAAVSRKNAPLLAGLKPRSKCSNQSFGRGGIILLLCAVPRPTDQPLTTLSAPKHDRPTDQRAVVGDFGWQLSKTPRRCIRG